MRKGVIWMLHSVEPDSQRTAVSSLYRNLTLPPARLESLIGEARARGYEFVPMSRFVADKADAAEHRNVLITIDDGFRNVYTEAFPVFRRLNVPFAFFVSTGLVERGFRDCPYAQLDGMAVLLDHAAATGTDFERLFRRYRRWKRWFPFVDGRRILRRICGGTVDFERYFRETVVAPSELKEMSDSGLCEIGSHTHGHVHVERARNLEVELTRSKSRIESWIGRPCEYFSYPYGHSDGRSIAAVRRHFRAATCDVREPPYGVTAASDDHLLPRMICTRDTSIGELLP